MAMASVWFGVIFYSCYLSNWLFAEKFSNCSNSLNFEAKINCNSIKPNVPKWRKICLGLKFDLVPFYGPQTKFKNIDNFGGPCIYLFSTCVVAEGSSWDKLAVRIKKDITTNLLFKMPSIVPTIWIQWDVGRSVFYD